MSITQAWRVQAKPLIQTLRRSTLPHGRHLRQVECRQSVANDGTSNKICSAAYGFPQGMIVKNRPVSWDAIQRISFC